MVGAFVDSISTRYLSCGSRCDAIRTRNFGAKLQTKCRIGALCMATSPLDYIESSFLPGACCKLFYSLLEAQDICRASSRMSSRLSMPICSYFPVGYREFSGHFYASFAHRHEFKKEKFCTPGEQRRVKYTCAAEHEIHSMKTISMELQHHFACLIIVLVLSFQLLLFGGNPTFTEAGERIVEGDIVVPKYADDYKELSHRKGTINLLALWSRATVYYTLHYSLNPLGRRMIREAMEHWENMTCIRFVERTTQLWYVRFRGDRNGCWSSMGRNLLPLIGQDLSIGNRCEKAFSSRMFEKNTVVSRNPHHQRLVGMRRNDLSFRDAKLINAMYRCDDEPPCGGNITDETIIETPGFPERNEPEMSCSWIITAPRRKEVEVEFEEFSFRERLQQQSSSFYGRCVSERVEIRNTDYYNGNFYCGTDIEPGTKMRSKGGTFIIIITADDEMEGKGLRAKITFV
ncbi:Zinc metalloproteinase nas-29 like protein [Argiope bruennichi]|uniref:Zinc metalloproteinase nas-29 like protein n=1 Tax=Argiope bruennichi TaxID=94029 RepID=A0A8T0E8R3_ARGBR|nr:Zinc metalloproteinase nas-29 like protein [Argiope bruennichi]